MTWAEQADTIIHDGATLVVTTKGGMEFRYPPGEAVGAAGDGTMLHIMSTSESKPNSFLEDDVQSCIGVYEDTGAIPVNTAVGRIQDAIAHHGNVYLVLGPKSGLGTMVSLRHGDDGRWHLVTAGTDHRAEGTGDAATVRTDVNGPRGSIRIELSDGDGLIRDSIRFQASLIRSIGDRMSFAPLLGEVPL